MDENKEKIIKEGFNKLPERIREFILSEFFETSLLEIEQKYQLNPEQSSLLEQDTTFVVMGLLGPGDYRTELSRNLNFDQVKIDLVAKDVEQKIFSALNKEALEVSSEPTPDMSGALDPRIQKLPEGIKKIIEDSKYQSALYDVARAHKLSISQMGTLERLTTDLITGTTRPEDFQKTLARSFALPPEEIAKLADEVNNKVFRKIREGLMIMSGRNPSEIVEQPVELPAEDKSLLKTHGIEVVDEVAPEEPEVHPLIAQKLSAPLQVPIIKTDHSPTPAPIATTEAKSAPAPAAKPESKPYAKGSDPYREIPE